MANTLTTLNSKLDTQLHEDTVDGVWTSAEKDDVLTWAVAGLWPRLSRELSRTNSTITLVTDTFTYAAPVEFMSISRIDWLNKDGDEMGPLSPGSWETIGDPFAGDMKIHVAPVIVDQGGTLKLIGYGRYTLETVTLATSLAADDIIDTATAHGYAVGQPVTFPTLTGGTGLSTDTTYYVISASLASTTFKVSATFGGSAVDFTADITAGTVAKDSLIPDDYVPLVLATARAELYRRITGKRSQYEQWAARNQVQDSSIGELMQLVNEADAEIARLSRRPRTQQRPVPARHG